MVINAEIKFLSKSQIWTLKEARMHSRLKGLEEKKEKAEASVASANMAPACTHPLISPQRDTRKR